jgi:selenocysteine-specific elongation factor
VILGTAGHIDHGKTALVKALTGVDTDRLPEEKRRGITIDLGFAPLVLDEVGTVGIVDVPGHEAFVRTMLAGASGIDMALLVVAADEGVMPQTREHLAILSLLNIPGAVVALSKCDLVTDEWLALVTDEVRSLLAKTAYSRSAIVPVSAVTGFGLTELREAIRTVASSSLRRSSGDDLFRMPVDRAFTVKGTGTVVTGTVWSGTLPRDSPVSVFPPGKVARVRGIQHHGRAVQTAEPGQRVALALSSVELGEVRRGSVVVTNGAWPATSRIQAEVSITNDDVVIGPRTRLRFHLGTADVGARVVRSQRVTGSGSVDSVATVVLDEPLLIRGGDRFVLRLPSPPSTIGGGIVIDSLPSRRRSPTRSPRGAEDSAEINDRIASNSVIARFTRLVTDAGAAGVETEIFPIRLGVTPAEVADLVKDAGLVETAGRVYDPRVLDETERALERAIVAHAETFPLELGVQLQSLRSGFAVPDAIVDLLLSRLVRKSRIEIEHSVVRPFGWTPKLNDRENGVAEAVMHDICLQSSEPPSVGELVERFGAEVPALLRYLERSGGLVRVADDRYYSAEAVERMVVKLRSEMVPGRTYSPAELREVLRVSRKYLIPFLEFCDVSGVTGRNAEGRVLGALHGGVATS